MRPTNIMGASKRLAELVVQDLAARARRTVFAMVRFGNVIGSSGSVIPLFKEQIARGGPVTVTDRDVTRYFMTSEEAVSLVLVAGSFATGGEVFVLDMGSPIRIWDMAAPADPRGRLYRPHDAENPDGDIEIEEIGLRPGEKLHEELLIGEGHITTAHEKIFCAREASCQRDRGRLGDPRPARGAGDGRRRRPRWRLRGAGSRATDRSRRGTPEKTPHEGPRARRPDRRQPSGAGEQVGSDPFDDTQSDAPQERAFWRRSAVAALSITAGAAGAQAGRAGAELLRRHRRDRHAHGRHAAGRRGHGDGLAFRRPDPQHPVVPGPAARAGHRSATPGSAG